jgi:hypothetical protein
MTLTYAKAADLMDTARKGVRRLANNTYLHAHQDGYAVQYHDTDVVVLRKDGTYVLDTGGWKTVSTKDRLNAFAPVRIHSERGAWYLADGTPYADGLVVDADGKMIKRKRDALADKLDAQVKAYVDGFVAQLKKEKTVPAMSGGDCWICLGMGGGVDHLLSHLDEKYYVPRLLYNAAVEARSAHFPKLLAEDVARGDTKAARSVLTKYFTKHRAAMLTELRARKKGTRP